MKEIPKKWPNFISFLNKIGLFDFILKNDRFVQTFKWILNVNGWEMDLILKILNATLVFKRLKIGMDESIDGCGNCMHAMMQRKLYL